MPRPPTAPPCPTTMGKLLPWWSKLVHRVLVVEACGRSETGDERTHRRVAADPTGIRLRAPVVDGAGDAPSRVDDDAGRPQAAGDRPGLGAQMRGGYCEEIDGDEVLDMVGQERAPGLGWRGASLGDQPGDGALGHGGAKLEEFAMDSGGAPQGFASAIRETRALISGRMGGRPAAGRPESLVQCGRKRRRCQRRTVSGATITRAALHPVHTLDRQIQKSRSRRRSFGRFAVLLYTASCWRKARFSRASWRWPPPRNGKRQADGAAW